MVDFLVGVLVTVAAVVVVRRLVGIRHGRWATTLIAVLIANAAAVEMLRLLYGSLRDVPGRAVFGAWALVTIFAVLAVLLVELLTRQRRRRLRHVPHPIRGARALGRRVLRYVEVARIWIHRGLLHTGDDAEVAGSRLGRSLRLSFEDAGGLFVKLGQAMAQQPQLVTPAVAAELVPCRKTRRRRISMRRAASSRRTSDRWTRSSPSSAPTPSDRPRSRRPISRAYATAGRSS